MSNSLYSLILNDDVVRQVDMYALKAGLSRSALINKVLAKEFNVVTPEMQLERIFNNLMDLLSDNNYLTGGERKSNSSLSVKSFIDVKYRPTIKYDVVFNKQNNLLNAVITVYFRTQSAPLLELLSQFFKVFVNIEKVHLPSFDYKNYSIENWKFIKTISFSPDLDTEKVSNAIYKYISTFDYLLKLFIQNRNAKEIEEEYVKHIGDIFVIE